MDLVEKVKTLPDGPGVYMFKDASGKVIYVGKAVSLRNRVRSYFQAGRGGKRYPGFVEHIHDVDFITTGSEVEALILESNLIKKHKPRYNIKLRDDKHYPYVRITLNEDFPRVLIARSLQRDGSKYFGPYTRAGAIRETLDTLRRVFPYRSCTNEAFKNATRPCLHYHIKRCPAPCAGLISREEYGQIVRDLCEFLEGRTSAVLERLKRRMEEAADRLEFETAARIRDRIKSIKEVAERQAIIFTDMKDRDVIGLAVKGNDACAQVFQVRAGKVQGREVFTLTETGWSDMEEVLGSFLKIYYSQASSVPEEVILPFEPSDADTIEEWLSGLRGGKVRLRTARRGALRDLVSMAQKNAGLALEELKPRELREAESLGAALDELAAILGLAARPHRIEGYDISNIQGRQPVGSMVVIEHGRPAKDQYRRFRIKTVRGPDDYAMMQEVLFRRFKRGLDEPEGKFGRMPDLVVVDGGRGQLNAALEVMKHLGVSRIPAVGLAKEREEVYVPQRAEPIRLGSDSPALQVLQRLRDEAHRFAVGYHRRLRTERGIRSLLDEVPGIGPKRRTALLKRFGSIERIREASVEELSRVSGMNRAVALKLKEHLGGGDDG